MSEVTWLDKVRSIGTRSRVGGYPLVFNCKPRLLYSRETPYSLLEPAPSRSAASPTPQRFANALLSAFDLGFVSVLLFIKSIEFPSEF